MHCSHTFRMKIFFLIFNGCVCSLNTYHIYIASDEYHKIRTNRAIIKYLSNIPFSYAFF